MNTLASSAPCVKTRSEAVLTDTPVLVKIRRARGCVRRAVYVAVYVTTGEHGASAIMDVTKRQALRLLKNYDRIFLSELFGSLIIGKPSPV